VLALSAVVVSGAAATPSGPGPGNSSNAKQCQQGGWENLYTSAGASFTSGGACTSYAAGGGTLYTKSEYLEHQWQRTCQNAGGSFAIGGGGTEWACFGLAVLFDQATYDALAASCTDAAGTPFSGPPSPRAPYDFISCDFD
jgi:hypothetical protein